MTNFAVGTRGDLNKSRPRKPGSQKNGKKGLLQLFSLLPTSYPGHNILTEDIGEIVDKKKCKCGIKGKFFCMSTM